MKRGVRNVFQTTLILMILGITAHAQPTVVTEIPNGSFNFVKAGDLVYFTSGDALLRTDGTASGTIVLRNGFSTRLSALTEFNNMLFFISGDELWRSDGTTGGTILLTTKSDLEILSGTGSTLFFKGSDAATGQELYRTTGTAAGTMLVEDINPGPGDGFLGNSAIVGDVLFFRGNNGINGDEPWKSDGTAVGTFMVKDINPGVGNGFVSVNFDDDEFAHRNPYDQGHVYSYNNQFFFSGNTTDNGQEPWVSDGTAAGTFMLKDTAPGMEDPVWILYGIGHDGSVYFITKPDIDPSTGRATATLWKTGGTTASTVSLSLLIEDDPDQDDEITYADPFRIYNGKVYFFGRQGYLGGHELWVTDGTPAGTQHVYSVNNSFGDFIMYFFEVVDDYLLFYGTADSYPTSVYRSDGTTAGTDRWIGFNSGGHDLYPRSLTAVGDFLFYGDHDGPQECCGTGGTEDPEDYFHLFQADPSALTTHSMRTLYGVSTRGTQSIVDYNGKVIFSTQNDQDESTDRQKYLWIYDPEDASTDPGECTASGSILRESWEGVEGSRVSDIPLNSEPSQTSQLSIFEGPTNSGIHYGARIHGYICPPESGDYTFWIASNDHSELWLSTDDDTNNKVRIAYVEGATGSRQWDKFASQKSAAIPLVAGQRYYIMTLHKQGVGTDNLAVGWQLPDGTMERPIAGARLSPFSGSPSNTPPMVTLTSPDEGQSFSEPATILVEADASDDDGSITKVTFYEGTNKLGEDLTGPYEFTWTDVPAGTYNLMAVATDNEGATADSEQVTITVQSGCMASGTITREYWSGVQGSQVSDVPVNSPPTSVSELTIFEGPSNVGVHYGSRIRGYICPPETGDYAFYISSNDHSELWLSTNADPANKVRIAWVMGATGERQWNKFASQQSLPVALTQGQTYYIEAIHKQGVGSDHLAVGWQIPGGTFERPVPGSRLSPFESEAMAMMTFDTNGETTMMTSQTMMSESIEGNLQIYPNPATSGLPELTISGYRGMFEDSESKVEIQRMTGEVVYQKHFSCPGGCGDYTLPVNQDLQPGIYLLKVINNGELTSRRLLIK